MSSPPTHKTKTRAKRHYTDANTGRWWWCVTATRMRVIFHHVSFHLELDAPVFIRPYHRRSVHFGYLFGGAHGARDDCNKSADKHSPKWWQTKTYSERGRWCRSGRESRVERKIPLLNGVINFLFEWHTYFYVLLHAAYRGVLDKFFPPHPGSLPLYFSLRRHILWMSSDKV